MGNISQNDSATAQKNADTLMEAWANPAMGMMLGITASPLLGVAWLAAHGMYTYSKASHTHKLDRFVEILKEGNFDFKEVNTKGFCEGLNIAFEAFMSARTNQKMSIIRRVLLGFSSSLDSAEFALERLCTCTNAISLESLKFADFLNKEVVPKLKMEFQDRWSNENPKETGKWFKFVPIDEPLGEYLERFDPNNKNACSKYGYDPSKGEEPIQKDISARMWRDQRYKSAEFDDAISELLGMGILRTDSNALGYQDFEAHFFTGYGIEFMKYLFEE